MTIPDRVFHVALSAATLPFCCGVVEFGHFYEENQKVETEWAFKFKSQSKESYSEAWTSVLKDIRSFYSGKSRRRLLVFNFQRMVTEEVFRHVSLKTLIESQPDILMNETFINSNTGNTVCMIVLKNEK